MSNVLSIPRSDRAREDAVLYLKNADMALDALASVVRRIRDQDALREAARDMVDSAREDIAAARAELELPPKGRAFS